MDIVTQGLLGASLAQCIANRELRAATTVGFIAGLLPDADTLIRSSSDPLLFLEFHRHFTHSLVFIPFGAALAAVLLWPVVRKRLRVVELYAFAFAGYALAGVLDACTSYGTALLWPFSHEPVAWNIVAIVDPVFSLTLLVGLIAGVWRRTNRPARIATTVAGCYLLLAAWQHQRVEDSARALAETRGHAVERLIVKPTTGNIVLWRSLYVHEGSLYADGIRQGLWGESSIYPGENAPLIDINTMDAAIASRFRTEDLSRFSRFSDHLLVAHPARSGFVGDARFAMLPTSLQPLWGIEATPEDPGTLSFVVDRELDAHGRTEFLRMLKGGP